MPCKIYKSHWYFSGSLCLITTVLVGLCKCSFLLLLWCFFKSTYNFLYNYTSWFCFISFLLFITHIFKQPVWSCHILMIQYFLPSLRYYFIVIVFFHRYASFYFVKHPQFQHRTLCRKLQINIYFTVYFLIFSYPFWFLIPCVSSFHFMILSEYFLISL